LLIALYKTSQFLDFAQRLKHFGSSSVFLLSEVDLRLLFAVFLPLGVVAMMALARLVDAAGIGAGYSILVATRAAFRFARQGFYAVQQVPTELLLRFLLPLGILAVVGRCCRGRRMPAAYPMFETAIAPSSL
jgi:preprotein translocase subunit SecY